MKISSVSLAVGFALLICGANISVRGAEETPARKDTGQAERFRAFEQTLSGATLEGRFTIVGREQEELPREQYTIRSVRKLADGDYWLFQARIKYADKDVTVPLPLEVKWAGDTPVITLTGLTIPGLGTFSARVLIDGQKYAGTWTHDTVGGHLFGVIKSSDSQP